MKRFALLVCLVASLAYAVDPTVVLDPAPGTYVGQRAEIVNTRPVSVVIAGDTLVLLNAAVTLASGASMSVVWNGSKWVAASATAGGFGLSGSVDFDFPVIGDNGSDPCAETNTVTITGAQITDQCSMSSNHGADGGSALSRNVRLSCRSVTNGAVGSACANLNDAGTIDLADAGYKLRTFR